MPLITLLLSLWFLVPTFIRGMKLIWSMFLPSSARHRLLASIAARQAGLTRLTRRHLPTTAMIVTTATDWTGKPEEVTVSTGESVDWNAGATISAAPVHRRIRKPFRISFQWGTEDKPAIAQVIRKGDIEAFNLTGISSPFSLIGHVQETLDRALYNVGGEFYADAFFEDDNEIEIPLNFKPVMFEGDRV